MDSHVFQSIPFVHGISNFHGLTHRILPHDSAAPGSFTPRRRTCDRSQGRRRRRRKARRSDAAAANHPGEGLIHGDL